MGYSPWGRKEWTQQSELSNNILNSKQFTVPLFSQMFRLVAVGTDISGRPDVFRRVRLKARVPTRGVCILFYQTVLRTL